MEYIDNLHDKRLREQADEAISFQKHQLAVGATPELLAALRKQIRLYIADFQKRFGDRIELLEPATNRADIRVRTNRYPLHVVELYFKETSVFYIKQHQQARDSSKEEDQGTVYIQAEFNQPAYFVYRGKPIADDELVQELLRELLEDASRL